MIESRRSRLATLVILILASPLLAGLTFPPRGDADHDASARHVFLKEELAFLEITLSPGALDSLFADAGNQDYRRCTLRFRNSLVDTTIANVGIRARGNTSLAAIKKSWKLSLNAFAPGRKVFGLEQMNLNGEHNDVSIIRSRLGSELYWRMGVPVARTHHLWLTINDGALVDGLHIHVEQIDEELAQAWFGNKEGSLYKCLYMGARADLRWVAPGTGAAYAALGGGETYSESNLEAPDHEDLAEFIDFVNHASDELFAAELGRRFSLDNFLRSMAVDVVMGHWDNYWYGANNYYLYRNSESGRLEYLPYDLDNTFGIDFSGINWATNPLHEWGHDGFGSDVDLPPLIGRILEVQAFEDQLARYVHEVAAGPFALSTTEVEIDAIKAMIEDYAFTGSYANGNMDWDFTSEMFHDSYTWPVDYRSWPSGWAQGLKPFIAEREAFLLATVSTPPALPALVINELQASNSATHADEWGEFDDWVEIRNDGATTLALGGLHLSDTIGNPTRFVFPDTLLPAGGHLLIWCDGQPEQGPWHAEFKLSAAGEELGLFRAAEQAMTPLDTLRFGPLATDVALGRLPDGGPDWHLFTTPTPGGRNDGLAEPVGLAPLRLSAYPNPFNPSTTLNFELPAALGVELSLYDVSGRRVRRLLNGVPLDAGAKEFGWDGLSDAGRPLPSGVYLARLRAGEYRAARTLVILR
jgi:hypothetical protein